MNSFSKVHPTVQFLFFAVVIIIPLSFSNPLLSAVSLISALFFSLTQNVKKGLKGLLYSLAAIVAVSVFNMIFAHYGDTVLFTVKGTNFTLEAAFFGFNQGMLLALSVIWFTYAGRFIDSERIMYLFRFAPKSVLLFSMILGFIPRFIQKAEDIRDAKAGLLGGKKPETFNEKMKNSFDNMSALISYSLESSIITADSMSAREYNPKAVRVSRFSFTNRDFIMLLALIILSFETVIQKIFGNLSFVFEPKVHIARLSLPALLSFAVLCLIPALTDLWENIKWKQLSSKA